MRGVLMLILLLFPASLWPGEFVQEMGDRRREREEAFSYIPQFVNALKRGEGLLVETLKNSPYRPFVIGEAYQKIGAPENALIYYEKAIQKAGDDESYIFDFLLLFEERKLDELLKVAFAAFLQNIEWDGGNEEISTFFYFKGKELLRERERDKGERYLRLARDLNPGELRNHIPLLWIHFATFNQELIDDFSRINRVLREDFKAQHLFVTTLFRSALLCLFALSIFLSLGLLLRYLPHLHHRILEILSVLPIFRSSVTPRSVRSIGGWILLAIPLLWGIPHYVLLLISLLLLWILVSSRKERILLFLVFLFLIAYPFILKVDSLLLIPLHPEGELSHLLSTMENERVDLKKLYAQAEERDDPTLYFTIGREERRKGNLIAAKEAYLRGIELDSGSSFFHNNLGNIYFELEEYEKAIKAYEKAISMDPESPLPHYNLSQVYSIQIRLGDATQELEWALELDPRLIQAGRRVIDQFLPSSLLWQKTFDNSISQSKMNIANRRYSILPILTLVLSMVGSIFLDRERLTSRCQLCRRPICSRCMKMEGGARDSSALGGRTPHSPVCPRCSKTLSTTTSSGFKEQFRDRMRRESEEIRRKRGSVFTLLFPGLGHLFIGSTWKGILAGFFAVLFWGFFLRIHPLYLIPPNPLFPPIPLLLFILLLYILTFRSFFRTLQRDVERKPVLEEKPRPPGRRESFIEARLKEEKMRGGKA